MKCSTKNKYISILEITDSFILEIIPYKFNTDATKIIAWGSEITEYIEKLSKIIQNIEQLKKYFKGDGYV